jgi:hypothetical protein
VIDPKSTSADLPELTDPMVVVAFEGWNDAGDAATGAVEHLELIWDATPLAALDPEDYYDFQVNRPTVSLIDGVSRRIEWPTTRRYEGPTGILGVFQDACVQAGLPAISFWAAVPHYVSQPPSPRATVALLQRVEEVLELTVPLGALPQQAEDWVKTVDEMANEDAEVVEYVRSLEERAAEVDLSQANGDQIAREFERYLRRRGSTGG